MKPGCEFCTTLLCARARTCVIFHSAHLKSCAVCLSVCTAGITFPLLHMKQFDSVSGFDVLTFRLPFYSAVESHAPSTCALCCAVSALKSYFSPCQLSSSPREQNKEYMRNVFSGIPVSVPTNQYPFPCK